MAYALVAAGTPTAYSTTGVTPAFAQSPTAGNLLVLWVCGGANSASSPSAPSGWSTGQQVLAANATADVFYKIAAGGDANPSVAAAGSTSMSAMVAEFSGNVGSSPKDLSTSATGATSPLVATTSGADAAAGELIVACGAARYSATGTKTTSHTFNNGATSNETSNDATTAGVHNNFSWGITTGNSSADSDSFAFTTTSISGAALVIVSFMLPAGTTKTVTPALVNASSSVTATVSFNPRRVVPSGAAGRSTVTASVTFNPKRVVPAAVNGSSLVTATGLKPKAIVPATVNGKSTVTAGVAAVSLPKLHTWMNTSEVTWVFPYVGRTQEEQWLLEYLGYS